MKKISMLIIAVGLLHQAEIKGQTAIGIKGGLNIADIDNNNYKPRVSGHVGVFVQRGISKYFRIQPELLFSGEGARVFYSGNGYTWAVNYLQIPVMLQVYPIKQIYIEAGPQLGLLLGAKEKSVNDTHRDIKMIFSTTQFAIGLGAGVEITDEVIMYGRYNIGLTDMKLQNEIDQHSEVVQVGIAFKLYKNN